MIGFSISLPSNDDWVVDSGASEHMIFDRSSFRSYVELDEPRSVRFGNNQFREGFGVGEVLVESRIGDSVRLVLLKDVLYVPTLSRKLKRECIESYEEAFLANEWSKEVAMRYFCSSI